MKKLKAILSFVFVLGIICLGFSFASNNYGKVNAFAYSSQIVLENSTFDMAGGTISNAIGDNGGAVYVGNGATFTMTGGKIKNCSATNGGAVYIANGGTFIFNGGTIENCVADLGYAIYVQAGGTLNYENNADGFTGCGEDEDLHIYAEEGATVIAPGTPINIYVDGGLSKTITAPAGATTYLLQESEMPLDYEHCCGYFLDSELRTTIKNDTIDLTSVGEEITFSPRTASASSDGINIYTRTADPSLFTFTTDGADGYILTKNSAVTYSGTEFNLIMPREYEDKTVTTIANSAFTRKFDSCGSVNITFSSEITEVPVSCFETGFGEENCNIKSINIHNNITSIGNYAFSYCIGFTGSLIIGDRVTSIGVCAFYYCFGLTGELIIPDSVTSIGDYAFYYCNGLTSVIIGNNVTSIGNYVFSDCSGLTSVTIGNSVTSIGDGAFRYCSGLTGELIMPNSVTSIGYEAFSSCSGLTGELIILDSVTSIGNSAFSSCSGLTSVTIGDSVTSIGSSAFYYCSGLTEVKVSSGNTVYEDRGK
ncbi:MAG: leucine-rich repeat domain-containing protein, partial [Clostridia bacterium]|nr:leucine-rich repeat domain-containing protein [Clostridia bacterium]